MYPSYSYLFVAVCLIAGSPSLSLAGESAGTDGLSLVARAIQKCGRISELGTCLRVKALTYLDRAIHGGPLVINDYLSLAPDDEVLMNETSPVTEREIEASLPKDQDAKVTVLDDMISEKFTAFLKSRSIKFHLPSDDESNVVDGRKKKDKYGGGYMMMGGMFGALMLQLALGTLALLAGKAFIVAKMALVLASITGLKKLLSSEGGESHQVVYATAGHEGGHHDWGRVAHDRVYSAHARTYGKRR